LASLPGAVVTNGASGVTLAGTFTGNLAGNASTATTAASASNATTANNFSGALAGDVAGIQGATVVSSVGGQTAANVASGASAANAATAANTAGAIVKRDTSGNFTAGTITANLAGNAATATTAANVTGNIADTQLSANIARLNGTNLFTSTTIVAGTVIATNANNVLSGKISGNGSGLTNLPATLNYVYSYDTTTQTVATAGTFRDVTFNTDAQINGWTHTAGGAGFTNGPGGLYLIEYAAETATATTANTTVSIRAVLNGTEIAGSQSASSPVTAGLASPISKSFIVRIPTPNTNVLKLQFTGSTVNNRVISNIGSGTTKPSVSMTVIRIQ
jgi:hypothetical protein